MLLARSDHALDITPGDSFGHVPLVGLNARHWVVAGAVVRFAGAWIARRREGLGPRSVSGAGVCRFALLGRRHDVLVQLEEVRRVVLVLQLQQALEARPVGLAHALLLLRLA